MRNLFDISLLKEEVAGAIRACRVYVLWYNAALRDIQRRYLLLHFEWVRIFFFTLLIFNLHQLIIDFQIQYIRTI